MARRKSDPVLQKLRRLARAGRRQEAADMLEQATSANTFTSAIVVIFIKFVFVSFY